jgi:homoprotocatechuate degradation regulator HpaR
MASLGLDGIPTMAKTRFTSPRKAVRRGGLRLPLVPSFGQTLAMLLLLAREAVMQRWRPFLNEHRLTDQQWRVIRALREVDSLEIIELGKRCCIHPASLSRILPKLAADGIVTRYTNSADQRRVIMSLSKEGRRLVDDLLVVGAPIHAELGRDIGEERLVRIQEALRELPALLAESKPSRVSAAAPRRTVKPRASART